MSWNINQNPLTLSDNYIRFDYNDYALQLDDTWLHAGTYHISFPLHNYLLHYETRIFEGPLTCLQLMQIIYNFYQEPLNPRDYKKAFQDQDEEFEELMEITNGHIKKIDVFSEDPDPDFCGIKYNDETNIYEIILGPI